MNLESISILYAEDEQGVRENVSGVLELYVNRVFKAQDGIEALEYYYLYKPDILLLDICMPKIDGLDALKKIRKEDLHTPAIIMTAHTEKQYLLKAVELYITKYLIKPFDKETLLQSLQECLQVITKDLGEIIELSKYSKYNINTKNIIYNNNTIKLNKKEISFLELLIKRSPNIVTYEEIEYHVWDTFDVSQNAFKSLVKDLRQKVGVGIISNRHGIGYSISIT